MWSLSGPDLSVGVQPYLHKELFEVNRNSTAQGERCLLSIAMCVTPAPACHRETPCHPIRLQSHESRTGQLVLPSWSSI